MKIQVRGAVLIATVALVAALSGIGGAYAGNVFVGSKQIKNGSIMSQDIHKGGVKSTDVANGAVQSADIGDGGITSADIGSDQVQPSDLALPDPQQVVEPAPSPAVVESEFALVDPVGTYVKVDAASALEVTWTGSAQSGFSPCQFQLRVDGQPAAGGAGVVYIQNGTTVSVSASALFDGLAAGPHEIQVFARTTQAAGAFPCTVGPAEAGVGQTFVIAEQIV